jgi:cell division protein FtsL
LSVLREEQKKLLDERERLRVGVSRLTHGKRISSMASEKLSMITPSGSPKNIFTVSPR